MTAGWVGLRWGELAGLALDQVDLLRHTITIDRQLTEVGGRVDYGPPKTSAGVRTVSIPAALTDVLAEHFATEPVQTSGLAFPTVTGRSMRRSNFRKVWRKAADGCFAGTDLAVPSHRVAEEAIRLVAYGLTPTQALAAVSRTAWQAAGLAGDFAPGTSADVVAFDVDPRDEITALLSPTAVVRAGHVLRGPA